MKKELALKKTDALFTSSEKAIGSTWVSKTKNNPENAKTLKDWNQN